MSQEDAATPPVTEAVEPSDPGHDAPEVQEDPPFLADESPADSAALPAEPRVFDAQAHAVTATAVEKVLADLHDKEVEEINQLKSSLIDSAELATRASGLAALAAGTMQKATNKLTETYGAAQNLGMICLAVFVALAVVAITLFGFMTYRLQERVTQLDAMLVAVGKRVVTMDDSIELFNNTGTLLGDVSQKQSGLMTSQKQLESRVDDVAKGLGNMIDAMAKKPAAEGNKVQDNTKQLQQALEQTTKQVQALEQKIQAQGEILKQLAAQGQRPVVVQTDAAALKKAAEAAAKSVKDKIDQEAAARAAAAPPPAPPPKPRERPVQFPRPGE